MRSTRVLFAASIVALTTVEACVADSTPPLVPEEDGGGYSFDAAGYTFDAYVPDAGVVPVDAGLDATVEDAPTDTTLADTRAPDASAADAGTDAAADASRALDAEPDVYDAGPAALDAGPDVADAGLVLIDAGSDVLDAAPDVYDAGPVVLDAAVADAALPFDAGPPQCATNVFGRYYTRTDGTVVQMAIGAVVVEDSTGLPLAGVTQVFDDTYSACALRATDHTVWCWPTFSGGNNANGQLGNGTFTDVTDSAKEYRATEVEIAHPDGGAVVYLDQVTSLTLGSEGNYVTAICAVRSDKTLWCWGPATQGALWKGTLGTTKDLAFATQLIGDPDAGTPIGNVDQVSVGNRHACYLSAGKVYCWGDNTSGELGTGDTTGQPYPFNVTANLPPTVDFIAANEDQTCALGSQQVFCWGADTYTSEGNPNVTRGICNLNYCDPIPVQVQRALSDGGVSANPLLNVTSIFVGYGFACGLDPSGSLRCWGDSTGSPAIAAEAVPFVNLQASVPSGPMAFVSGYGAGGFNTQLNYITTSGVLVSGANVVPQICP